MGRERTEHHRLDGGGLGGLNRLQPSGKLLFSADGTVIQEAHLSSYSGREGEFVPIPMGLLNIVDQSRDFSPPESYRYTQAEIETIRRWRITKEGFPQLEQPGLPSSGTGPLLFR